MSSPAPKSPEQSDKSKKYDRQIRLWGEHGQRLLEQSSICLINATALGCEVLKGLVLPGIGGFTIIDGTVVTESDLGTNFFLDASLIGQSKAAACTRLLQELNPDVKGDFLDEGIDYTMEHRPAMFSTFDVVIATNLGEQSLLQLSKCLWDANIPLIYCRSLGFFGSIRLQIKEHCVIEAHPDNVQHDLRLAHPFDALQKHFECTKIDHTVPWLLVFYKYLRLWKSQNDGNIPETFNQKLKLREMIRQAPSANDENHLEAIKAVHTALGGGTVSVELKTIFEDKACEDLNQQSKTFWIMAKALKEFVVHENNGHLPLAGVLPDMTAHTESYINLQNVYRQQALQDADSVYRKCQKYIKELQLPEDTITEQMVRLFCREAHTLAVIRGSKIFDAYQNSSRILSFVDDMGVQGTFTNLYVAMRAFERFQTIYGHIAGECYVENDISRMKSIAGKMLTEWGAQASVNNDMIHEICRYGGAEVHSISAFIGGCVAQETIKIITKQYKPIDNTFLYNGITSETTTIKL